MNSENKNKKKFKDELLKQNGIEKPQSHYEHFREKIGFDEKQIQTQWVRTFLLWVLATGCTFILYMIMGKTQPGLSNMLTAPLISPWEQISNQFNSFPFSGWWNILFYVLAVIQTFKLFTNLHQQKQKEYACQSDSQNGFHFRSMIEKRNKDLLHMRWGNLAIWLIAIVTSIYLLTNKPGANQDAVFYTFLFAVNSWLWLAAILSSILLFFRKRTISKQQLYDRLEKIELMLEKLMEQQEKQNADVKNED